MNEQVLRRLWLAGTWPEGSLRDTLGHSVQLVYPGRRGHGYGPDLLDAIAALPDGLLVKGDVEFHVKASDWNAHGHARDPRYGNVVIHVVWRDDVASPIHRAVGQSESPPLVTIALEDLDQPTLFARLSRPHDSTLVHHEWLAELPPPDRAAFIESHGDARFAANTARLAGDITSLGADEALYRALLDALGYSQNRTGFARLTELVPAAALRCWAGDGTGSAEDRTLANLLCIAGFLGTERAASESVERSAAIREHQRAVDLSTHASLRVGTWQTVGVRPANRVPRRLAALARISTRLAGDSLAARLDRALRLPEPKLAAAAVRDLVRVGRVPAHDPSGARLVDYWLDHHDFGARLPRAPQALLGEERARAIAINVMLPFAAALADLESDRDLAERVARVWRVAPGGDRHWILDEMRSVLVGIAPVTARLEQGAIELYRRCCADRRCAICPARSAKTGQVRA